MRQIVLDTETTGLDPAAGHRIIEIGCVELIDRRLSGNRFHKYLNPEREIDRGAVDVHGLDLQFLADKPRFAEIAEEFLDFVRGCELIIHNAPFDLAFLNAELDRLDRQFGRLEEHCRIIDTLELARSRHPGQRNSLDALCKRYGIDNRQRHLHGALLDAEILARVYLVMTSGQIALGLDSDPVGTHSDITAHERAKTRPRLKVAICPEQDLIAHQNFLKAIAEASGRCLWLER